MLARLQGDERSLSGPSSAGEKEAIEGCFLQLRKTFDKNPL
jgi:hypothetical protein